MSWNKLTKQKSNEDMNILGNIHDKLYNRLKNFETSKNWKNLKGKYSGITLNLSHSGFYINYNDTNQRHFTFHSTKQRVNNYSGEIEYITNRVHIKNEIGSDKNEVVLHYRYGYDENDPTSVDLIEKKGTATQKDIDIYNEVTSYLNNDSEYVPPIDEPDDLSLSTLERDDTILSTYSFAQGQTRSGQDFKNLKEKYLKYKKKYLDLKKKLNL